MGAVQVTNASTKKSPRNIATFYKYLHKIIFTNQHVQPKKRHSWVNVTDRSSKVTVSALASDRRHFRTVRTQSSGSAHTNVCIGLQTRHWPENSFKSPLFSTSGYNLPLFAYTVNLEHFIWTFLCLCVWYVLYSQIWRVQIPILLCYSIHSFIIISVLQLFGL